MKTFERITTYSVIALLLGLSGCVFNRGGRGEGFNGNHGGDRNHVQQGDARDRGAH